MAEAPVPVPPLTADEQDAKFVEDNMPLLAAFNALTDRQKIMAIVKYIERYGALPTPPEPAPEP